MLETAIDAAGEVENGFRNGNQHFTMLTALFTRTDTDTHSHVHTIGVYVDLYL